MSLRAECVSASYPSPTGTVLKEVSFALSAGEFVVIAGPNGCGKSTLIRTLIGLHPIDHGRVTLGARPIGEIGRAEIARNVAMLPQREESTFPLLTSEAVMLGRWASLGALSTPGPEDFAAVARAIEACRLTALTDRMTDTLSGGEWQRVRLARALVAEPQLILLDEPGTALDIAHEMALYQLLSDQVSAGRGALVVTHHLNAALRYATRVVLIKTGKVVVDGPPHDVLTNEVVSHTFDWPLTLSQLDDGTLQIVPSRVLPSSMNRPSVNTSGNTVS